MHLGSSLESVFTLLVLVAIGYYLQTQPWFQDGGGALLSKYAIRIAVPVNIVYTVYNSFGGKEELLALIPTTALFVCAVLAVLVVSIFASKLFRIQEGRRGVFIAEASTGNSVFIGLPVVQAIFGDTATPIGMACYAANTMVFWTLCAHFMYKDNPDAQQQSTLKNLKKLLSPPFVAFLIGVAIASLGVPIPKLLLSPMRSVSQTATPLAMMYIGSAIRKTDFRQAPISKDIFLVVMMRLMAAPLITALVCMAAPVSPEIKQILFIFSAMPAMTQIAILSNECGSDASFAAVSVSLSTLTGLVTIPFYVLLLQIIQPF